MVLKTNTFDISVHLDTPDTIRDFLQEVISNGDTSDFIHALNTAIRAVGMTQIAKKAGVSRASLYKSLSENGNPKFSTINKVTRALGCKLSVA